MKLATDSLPVLARVESQESISTAPQPDRSRLPLVKSNTVADL